MEEAKQETQSISSSKPTNFA